MPGNGLLIFIAAFPRCHGLAPFVSTIPSREAAEENSSARESGEGEQNHLERQRRGTRPAGKRGSIPEVDRSELACRRFAPLELNPYASPLSRAALLPVGASRLETQIKQLV
jgi:hypothetical protein